MYMRMIIGNNLVSIFFRIFFSASILSSALIAATRGGGTSLRCPSTAPFPASSVVGTILSSDRCSMGCLSSAIVAMIAVSPRVEQIAVLVDSMQIKARAQQQEPTSNNAGPQASTYTTLAGTPKHLPGYLAPSTSSNLRHETKAPIPPSQERLPTTVQEYRPAIEISTSRRRDTTCDSSIWQSISSSNMLMQRCACDTGWVCCWRINDVRGKIDRSVIASATNPGLLFSPPRQS